MIPPFRVKYSTRASINPTVKDKGVYFNRIKYTQSVQSLMSMTTIKNHVKM